MMISFCAERTATHLLGVRRTVAVKVEHCVLFHHHYIRAYSSNAARRFYFNTTPTRLTAATGPEPPPNIGKIVPRRELKATRHTTLSATKLHSDEKMLSGSQLTVKAGLPLILFALLSAWVVSNAYAGKLRELEASQGKVSVSIRQAAMEQEHEEMMERLNKIVAADFDNTKRIKRPEEILEERRKERQRRNAWHRRLYRWVFRKQNEVA